ncbi:MAG: ATP-binding cassette domain-containing protein [Mycoplasmoidaceae bacterium]
MENKKILSVENVNKYFKNRGVLKHSLNDISFHVNEGDFLGVIGESGSGKTTLGKAIIRLIDVSGGNIYFFNKNISSKRITNEKKKWITKNMQMIFQDPLSSLNPNMNIIKLISEPLEINKEIFKDVKNEINERIIFNKFYKYKFLKDSKKNVISNSILFFKEYNEILKNLIMKNKKFVFSNPNDYSFSYNEIENIYDKILNSQKKLVDYLNNISLHDSLLLSNMQNKLKNNDLEKEFINLYDLCKREEIFSGSNSKIIAEFKNSKNDLKKFKFEWKHNFEKKLLKNNLKDVIFSYKFNKIRASLAVNKIDYLRYKSASDYAKIKIILLNKGFKYKFIDTEYFLEKIKVLLNYLSNIYNKVDLEIKSIIEENNYKNNYERIYKKYNFKFILLKVEDYFNKKIKKILTSFNEELYKKYNATVSSLKEKIIKSKKSCLLNKNNLITDLKTEKIKIKNSKKLINKNVKNFYTKFKREYLYYLDNEYKSELSLLKVLKSKNCKYRKSLEIIINNQLKKLYELKPETLNYLSLKKRFSFLNGNKKAFKSQIKIKKSASLTTDWEYKNIIDKSNIYQSLFSKSRMFLYFLKGDLIDLNILKKIYSALEDVGLKKEHAYRYPHEFSGGQRQRIAIARALISKPKFIIADEAISALDVSIQAQVINIMKNLSKKQGVTFLFIAHDLSMVRSICNKAIIMHNGRIVEKGLVNKIFEEPIHPYTISLFKAIPEINKMHIDLASFNVYHDYDLYYSSSNIPKFFEVSPGHQVLATDLQFKQWKK